MDQMQSFLNIITFAQPSGLVIRNSAYAIIFRQMYLYFGKCNDI